AALVLRKTMATEFALPMSLSFNTEPPLKPNQPNHRMKVPRVANGRLAPVIAWISPLGPYLPLRAPSRITPARAAAAPAMCTMPEPAKPEKPRSPRLYIPSTALPPQVHEPSTGYMAPVMTTANSRRAESYMRSATEPDTMDMAVATETAWKKKSAAPE